MENTIERTADKAMKRMSEAVKPEPKEGKLTKKVEEYTASIPSLAYLGLAVGSMILSASVAAFTKKKNVATFIGLWVPTLMLVGVYNKLVKIHPYEDAR